MKCIKILLVAFIFWTTLCFNIGIVEGIVGGQVVTDKRFRYQISLQANNEHICGGVIFTKEHVITAANCLIDSEEQFIKRKYVVVAGINNLKGEESDRVEVNVEKIFVPTEYKRRNPDKNPSSSQKIYYPVADLAVLKLEQKLLVMNPSLMAINIPIHNIIHPTFEGRQGFVSGFGIDHLICRGNPDDYGQYCNKLKFGATYILNQRICSQKLHFELDKRHICTEMANYLDGRAEGVCDGDIGGPLIIPNNNLIGILSHHASDCNEKNSPSLYTRVSDFMNFIHNAMTDEFKKDMRMAYYRNKVIEENRVIQKELVEMYHLI